MLKIVVLILAFLSVVRIISLIFLAKAMKPDTDSLPPKEKKLSADEQELLKSEEEREYDSFF
ncbi:hypothetical protein DDV21_003715 [Streptococcus chenjunshii]|uniref:Uncharacterized protein n=1 Tax=Streptococcus chenjunshii TaxID=2173853 RepID=A0A372KM73_9STRE|nr:hypothetical protein [Streptococcus chenjunshii]AXQ78247.1 hypothetical protein DDV21_003715 [Streptococcus chenjunshii]RFU50466.1 hypothetical protein DDV22_08635 [Streptococcus chenjunshii]RFU52678.1 hypothetical protein DDV23_08390 [Streptococcus chenjunshii]